MGIRYECDFTCFDNAAWDLIIEYIMQMASDELMVKDKQGNTLICVNFTEGYVQRNTIEE